jgi:hypothetical protein
MTRFLFLLLLLNVTMNAISQNVEVREKYKLEYIMDCNILLDDSSLHESMPVTARFKYEVITDGNYFLITADISAIHLFSMDLRDALRSRQDTVLYDRKRNLVFHFPDKKVYDYVSLIWNEEKGNKVESIRQVKELKTDSLLPSFFTPFPQYNDQKGGLICIVTSRSTIRLRNYELVNFDFDPLLERVEKFETGGNAPED